MRTLVLAPALLAGLLLLPAPAAHADPLLCFDPGAVEIENVITVDPPEVCIL